MVEGTDPRGFYGKNAEFKAEYKGQEFPVSFINFELPDTDTPQSYFEENYREDNYRSEWEAIINEYDQREKHIDIPSYFPKEEKILAMLFTSTPKKDDFHNREYQADTKGILIKGEGQEYYLLVKHGGEYHFIKIPLFSSEAKIIIGGDKDLPFPKDYHAFADLENSLKRNIRPLKDVMSEIIIKSTKAIEEHRKGSVN